MKKSIWRAMIFAVACVFQLHVARAEIMLDGEQAAVADCNYECCGSSGSWIGGFEATFMRFHEDSAFANSGDVFGFEFAPRVTLAYVTNSGLGIRGRWWYYDHAATDAVGDVFDISATNVDVEAFEEIQLNCCTTLEWSAGTRFTNYKYADTAEPAAATFSAPGLLIGARLERQLPIGGAMYASVRNAWLMSDQTFDGVVSNFDVTRTISEAAIGYQYCTCLSNGSVLSLSGGVEIQQWNGFGYIEDFDESAGFGGFVFGANLTY